MSWVYYWFSPCSEGFSPGSPVFLPPEKTNISKFQLDQDRGPAWKAVKADAACSLNIVIYYMVLVKYKKTVYVFNILQKETSFKIFHVYH